MTRFGFLLTPALSVALALAGPLSSMAGTTAAGEATVIPSTPETPAIPAYVARPKGSSARAPGVLVLHGCEGYRTRYGQIADMLASNGYVAVAIDTLAPRAVKNACGDPSGSRFEAQYAIATLAWMRAQPYVDQDRLALLGYSMGSIATLDIVDSRHVSTAPPGLRAAIAYYPACRNRDAAVISVPLLILDGDADDWTPAPPCQALAQAAAVDGKTVSIATYPGATHAFNVDAPDRVSFGHLLRYDAAAGADAQSRTLAFLRTYLGP